MRTPQSRATSDRVAPARPETAHLAPVLLLKAALDPTCMSVTRDAPRRTSECFDSGVSLWHEARTSCPRVVLVLWSIMWCIVAGSVSALQVDRPQRLNLGSGRDYKEGWVNLD